MWVYICPATGVDTDVLYATGFYPNSSYLGHFLQLGGGVAGNTKKTTKTMGVTLRSSGNEEGPGQVWMALLEQHSPSSPVFHNFRHSVDSWLF